MAKPQSTCPSVLEEELGQGNTFIPSGLPFSQRRETLPAQWAAALAAPEKEKASHQLQGCFHHVWITEGATSPTRSSQHCWLLGQAGRHRRGGCSHPSIPQEMAMATSGEVARGQSARQVLLGRRADDSPAGSRAASRLLYCPATPR